MEKISSKGAAVELYLVGQLGVCHLCCFFHQNGISLSITGHTNVTSLENFFQPLQLCQWPPFHLSRASQLKSDHKLSPPSLSTLLTDEMQRLEAAEILGGGWKIKIWSEY